SRISRPSPGESGAPVPLERREPVRRSRRSGLEVLLMLNRTLGFVASMLALTGCTAGTIVDIHTNKEWQPHPPPKTPANAGAPIVQVLFAKAPYDDKVYAADVQFHHAYGSVFSFDPAGPGTVTQRGTTS